jgi:hypothetical protein
MEDQNTSPRRKSEFSLEPSRALSDFLAFLGGFHVDREKSKAADWALVLATLLAVLAAGYSAVLFFGQLREARRNTDAVVRNFIIDERPWVEPQIDTLNYPPEPILAWSVRLKNAGKTAAKRIYVKFAAVPRDKFVIEESYLYQQPKLKAAPGMSSDYIPVLAPNTTSVDSLDYAFGAVPKTTKTFIFIGRIDYSDAFEKEHWVNFCYWFDVDSRQIEAGCNYHQDENTEGDNS